MKIDPFPLTEHLQQLQQPYPPDPHRSRRWWHTVRGWFAYYTRPPKTFILCLSAMRSGSTLLKALLGQASDIAHLPEYNFQRFHATPLRWYHHAARQSHEPILLFKQPAPVRECTLYPLLPTPTALSRARFYYLVLVRDPAATIASLLTMHRNQNRLTDLNAEDWLAYWGATYTEILNRTPASSYTRIVHYEALIADPIAVTEDLFQWLGIPHQKGVDTYTPPEGNGWQWGKDDAGDNIHTRRVQPHSAPPLPAITDLCNAHPDVTALLNRFHGSSF